MAANVEQGGLLGATPRTAAQTRTLKAALDLFAEFGVGATSYQMIADALGVTKGAIYHQFRTKDEIIVAVAEMELAKLEDALEAAESEDDQHRGRELLLNRIIDHAIEHRLAVVNAIPYVVQARPGLLSALDLPLTLPRNAFHPG